MVINMQLWTIHSTHLLKKQKISQQKMWDLCPDRKWFWCTRVIPKVSGLDNLYIRTSAELDFVIHCWQNTVRACWTGTVAQNWLRIRSSSKLCSWAAVIHFVHIICRHRNQFVRDWPCTVRLWHTVVRGTERWKLASIQALHHGALSKCRQWKWRKSEWRTLCTICCDCRNTCKEKKKKSCHTYMCISTSWAIPHRKWPMSVCA